MLKFGNLSLDQYLRYHNFNQTKNLKMKKVFAIFATAALTACGGAETPAETASETVSTASETTSTASETTSTASGTTSTATGTASKTAN